MSEIVPATRKRGNGAMVPVSQPVADTLLNFVAQAVRDPSIDVTKLDILLRMQREIVADDGKLQYRRAMNAAQAETQPVTRDTQNAQTNSFYAKLETVVGIIQPIYIRHGFSLSFDQVEPMAPGNIRIACTCMHIGGHAETFYREAPPDTLGPKGTPTKTPLHGLGSVDTYLKRYIICGIFNVVLRDMDRDGNRTRDDGEVISGEQVRELVDLIARCPAPPATTERSLLNHFGLNALRSIKEVPPDKFQTLRTALRNSQQRQATQGQAA